MNQVSRKDQLTADPVLAVRQIGQTFGAEVTGMPIHGDVSPELLSLIHI